MGFICVCVKINKEGIKYSIMSVKTNKITDVPQLPESIYFNLKKYEDGLKKGKVYTVLGEVSYSLEYKSFLGYLVRDSMGNVDIYKDVDLFRIAKKYTIMNYTLVDKADKSYLRRNANNPLITLTDKEIKSLYHLSFDNLDLNKQMSLEEIEFCMQKNNFELGYREEFIYDSLGKELKCDYRVYFNKEGTLIRLTYAGNRGLDYFRNSCVIMRHIDRDKYISNMKEHCYDMGSSCPVDGLKTDIMINEYTIEGAFTRIARNCYNYSTPCRPYYLSPVLDGLDYMLDISEKQNRWIDNYFKNVKKEANEGNFGSFLRTYVSICNIKRYSPKLQMFYKNILDNIENIVAFEAEFWCLKWNARNKEKDENQIKANKRIIDRLRIDIDKAFMNGEL